VSGPSGGGFWPIRSFPWMNKPSMPALIAARSWESRSGGETHQQQQAASSSNGGHHQGHSEALGHVKKQRQVRRVHLQYDASIITRHSQVSSGEGGGGGGARH